MKFENHNKRVDEILDKISKNGIGSLSQNEVDYLYAFSVSDRMKMINLDFESRLKDFKSIDGYFEFKFSHIVNHDDNEGIYYYGTITVPDLKWNNNIISGEMDGYILVLPNKDKIPCFDSSGYDILDFCNGIEYELDSFIDYVIDTLEDEKNSR